MDSNDGALPVYSEQDNDGLVAWVDSLALNAAQLELPLTYMRFEPDMIWIKEDGVTVNAIWRHGTTKPAADPAAAETAARILMTQKRIIETFFRLVRMGQTGAVTVFVQKGLVSPDVTDAEGYDDGMGRQYVLAEFETTEEHKAIGDPSNGASPLLVAVDQGDAAMARVLLSLGADINYMARPPNLRPLAGPAWHGGIDTPADRKVRRTPLMLAAAQGKIALVKLFFEELNADDALMAPDGQIALRLAAEGRHRDIVALLPARRGGSWRRFRTRHARAMDRIRHAGNNIAWFTKAVGKFVVWDFPKFMLYTVPKECIVEPLARFARYLWEHRSEIPGKIWHAIVLLPYTVATGLRDVGRLLARLARAIGRTIARIPAGLKIAAIWVAETLKVVGSAIANVAGRTLSAVHTALAAAASWFKQATLQDVVNGIKAAFEAVFVGLPLAVWAVLSLTGKYTYKALREVFGCVGAGIYVLGVLIWTVVMFIPRNLGKMLAALGSSIASAFHEMAVWFNPKTV